MKLEKIRTLFITKEVPYPPMGGVSLRNWQNINIMMKFGPVAVFSAANWSPKAQSFPGVTVWKHCNVEEQRSSLEQIERRLWWLRPYGDPDADWGYAKSAAQELKALLTEFKPDIVIFEQVWLFRYLPIVKPFSCKTILDNHNVEAHLFKQKNYENEDFKVQLKAKIQENKLQSMEREFSRQVDQIWVCSQEDQKLMQQLYNQVSCYVVPNGINLANYEEIHQGEITPPPDLENSQHNLLFVGQLSYYPNIVAVELLINQIYPQLKQKYPDCRLLLVGRTPTTMMLEAAKIDPNIIVTGRVEDVRPYLSAAKVMVVPLLHGGGTRLKILEAFAAKCPVISTAKGVEGVNAKDEQHLLIRDDIKSIIDAVEQIWSEPDLGIKLTTAAYEKVQSEYSWEAINKEVNFALSHLHLD